MIPDKFSAVYDEAMAARREIAEALKAVPYDNSGISHCLLQIGDKVNFVAYIVGRNSAWGADIYEKAVYYFEQRDATVEDIKACTARTIAQIKNKTREGRIAELREKLKKMEEGEL